MSNLASPNNSEICGVLNQARQLLHKHRVHTFLLHAGLEGLIIICSPVSVNIKSCSNSLHAHCLLPVHQLTSQRKIRLCNSFLRRKSWCKSHCTSTAANFLTGYICSFWITPYCVGCYCVTVSFSNTFLSFPGTVELLPFNYLLKFSFITSSKHHAVCSLN